MTLQTPSKTSAPRTEADVFVRPEILPETFPRGARVRAKAEFTAVFASGKRTAEPRLALHWLADDASPRMGLAVSRKVDPNAVGRNRIKRQLRERFRRLRPYLKGGSYVLVARSAAAASANVQLAQAFEQLLIRAGALPRTVSTGTMPPASSISTS